MPVIYSRRDQASLLEAAKVLTHSRGWSADAHALGAFLDDRLIAVAVIQRSTEIGAEAHFGTVGDAWKHPEILRVFCKYAFDMHRNDMLTFPVAWDNVRAQVGLLRSGARVSGLMGAGVMMDRDAILLSMRRDMCRWLATPSHNTNHVAEATNDQ